MSERDTTAVRDTIGRLARAYSMTASSLLTQWGGTLMHRSPGRGCQSAH
jgi:hypothetical protein